MAVFKATGEGGGGVGRGGVGGRGVDCEGEGRYDIGRRNDFFFQAEDGIRD